MGLGDGNGILGKRLRVLSSYSQELLSAVFKIQSHEPHKAMCGSSFKEDPGSTLSFVKHKKIQILFGDCREKISSDNFRDA